MLKQLENIVLSPESELYLAQFFNKLITKSEQLTGKTNDVRTIKFSRLFSRLCIRLIDGMGPEHGPKALNVLFSIFHARCPMTMILPSAEYSSTLMESLSKKDIDAFDGMIRLFGSIIVEKFYCKDYAWRWVASLCNGDPQRCPHIIDCLESITIVRSFPPVHRGSSAD